MDPTYESEKMETNLESMYKRVNQMANFDMTRDFNASLSKHFFREGEVHNILEAPDWSLSIIGTKTTSLEKKESQVSQSIYIHVLSSWKGGIG